jgi:catechol 2,3-dioxygenase-like lactoylglutathione lyase family enzyme
MLRHVGVNVRDLIQAKAYYDILMPILGFEPHIAAADQFAYRPINDEPGASLFFYSAIEQSPYSRHHPGLQHLAFMVESRAAVHAAHTKAIELGSEVVHTPSGFPPVSPLLLRYILAGPRRLHAGGDLLAGGRGHVEHAGPKRL